MADYENPVIPEGINVSPTHPLKDFAVLLAGVTAVVIVVVLALSLLAGMFARHVPFAQEQALAATVSTHWPRQKPSTVEQQREQYLQTLADQLSTAMKLPAEMKITVHYSSDDTVNAMAMLGGNIIIFQGLIDALPHENALAMVVAHEIAHVRQRHPIVAMGRGFTVALALSVFAGVGDGLMQDWISSMGILPVLSFSRSQEEEADADALRGMHAHYGHVEGAAAFFEHMAKEEATLAPPAIFSTHPGHEDRLDRIEQFRQAHSVGEKYSIVVLPDFMKKQKDEAPE